MIGSFALVSRRSVLETQPVMRMSITVNMRRQDTNGLTKTGRVDMTRTLFVNLFSYILTKMLKMSRIFLF